MFCDAGKGARLNLVPERTKKMAEKKIEAVVAKPRTGTFNKNHARRVRVQGLIPAVVYGAGQESVAVTVDPKVITKILYSDSGHNTIFDLTIEGAGVTKAMIVDWQNEPIKGKLLHIDLKRIAMDKSMVGFGAGAAGRSSGRREELWRHSEPGAARGRDRVLAGRYSGPHRCRCDRISSFMARSTSPIFRTRAS